MRVRVVVAGIVLLLAAVAQAAPLKFESVGADAKWLVHLNADAARASTVVRKAFEICIPCWPGADEWRERMHGKLGMNPRKDLHSVTLYGAKLPMHEGVAIVRANVDKTALLEKARKAPRHKTVKHRDYEICTWTSPKGPRGPQSMAGAFYKDDVLVFAANADRVGAALDVLDGKAPNLAGKESLLTGEVPDGTIMVARAVSLEGCRMLDRMPALKQVKQFDVLRGEDKGTFFTRMTLTATSADAAKEFKNLLTGLQAAFALHFHDSPGLVKLLYKVDMNVEGDTLRLKSQVPADDVIAQLPVICEAIKQHIRHHMEMHKRWEGRHHHDRHHRYHRGHFPWRHHEEHEERG